MAVNTVHYFYLSGNWTSAKWVSLQEALSGNKARVQLVWGNWGVWYPMWKPYIYHWRAHKNSQIRGSIWKFVIHMQPFHNGTLVLLYFLEFCSVKFMQVYLLITTVHQSPYSTDYISYWLEVTESISISYSLLYEHLLLCSIYGFSHSICWWGQKPHSMSGGWYYEASGTRVTLYIVIRW